MAHHRLQLALPGSARELLLERRNLSAARCGRPDQRRSNSDLGCSQIRTQAAATRETSSATQTNRSRRCRLPNSDLRSLGSKHASPGNIGSGRFPKCCLTSKRLCSPSFPEQANAQAGTVPVVTVISNRSAIILEALPGIGDERAVGGQLPKERICRAKLAVCVILPIPSSVGNWT